MPGVPAIFSEPEQRRRTHNEIAGRFLLVMTLLGQFVVSALCQQGQSSGTTGSTSNAATLPAAPVINPDQFKPVHDDALSNWSPPRRFHFNCHCV
jgi:hypothetical protein